MAPRSDYPEDWQLQCGELKQRGAHLLKSGLWTDCSFSFTQDQVVIKAHKLILAMASPVFEAMFYGLVAEGNNPISILDMHAETFQELLEYVYTDNIELDSFEKACNLYYGAQKYMLTHLLTVCTMYLSCNLTPDLACQMYEFALMVGEDDLAKECEQMIISETSSILLMKGFKEISLDTMEKIFAMNNLNISSELELFKAAECYAKSLQFNGTSENAMEIDDLTLNKSERPAADASNDVVNVKLNENEDDSSLLLLLLLCNNDNGDGDNKEENLPDHNYSLASSSKEQDNKQEQEIGIQCRAQFRKLLQHIRFLTLTPAELAEYPTLTSLLTESEILSLMMNIASVKTYMPMPEGFSVSRTKR